jgi:hypothetical protein
VILFAIDAAPYLDNLRKKIGGLGRASLGKVKHHQLVGSLPDG